MGALPPMPMRFTSLSEVKAHVKQALHNGK